MQGGGSNDKKCPAEPPAEANVCGRNGQERKWEEVVVTVPVLRKAHVILTSLGGRYS